jgi:hypothetical protein
MKKNNIWKKNLFLLLNCRPARSKINHRNASLGPAPDRNIGRKRKRKAITQNEASEKRNWCLSYKEYKVCNLLKSIRSFG